MFRYFYLLPLFFALKFTNRFTFLLQPFDRNNKFFLYFNSSFFDKKKKKKSIHPVKKASDVGARTATKGAAQREIRAEIS